MKAQSKAIVASLVVLALAVCAVSGVTYSWWSDSENSEISINTGGVDVAITDFNVTKNGENLGYTEFVDSISLITSVPDVENPEPVDVFVISYKATMKASVDAKFLIGYSCNNDDVTTGMTIGGEESIASGVWNTFDVTEGQIREDRYDVVLTVTIDVSKVQFANIVVDLENMITQVDNPVWDGSIPASKPDTLVVDTQNKLISVDDVQAFAYLNTLVNDPDFYDNYGSKWQYTVELNTDVNLNGLDWTPMTLSNFVAFEGNYHTISNLKVDVDSDCAGLFGTVSCNDIGVTYVRNLNIVGADVSGNDEVGVVVGSSPQGAIVNVRVYDFSVTGVKYVGGIFGWGNGSANGCTVENGTVTIPADGLKEAGGLIGYLSNDGKVSDVNKVISGNKVKDVVIKAPTVASGLVSQPNSSNKGGAIIVIEDNELENVSVYTYDDSSAALYVSYNVDGKSRVEDNTAAGCKTGTTSEVYDSNKFAEVLTSAGAASAGNTLITLENDLDFTGVVWTPIKVDGYHGADVVTLDGQGHTIKGLSAPLFAGGFAGESGIVITNLTIADSNIVGSPGKTSEFVEGTGAFIECADSMNVITLENCHLVNSIVSGDRTGGLIGWTSGYSNQNDGPVKTYVTISNCSVKSCTINGSAVGGINGHAGASDWTYTTIENCTVTGCTLNSTDDGGWRVGVVVGTANVGEVTINNITESENTLTQTGKTAPDGQSNLYGRFVPGETGKLVIDGVEIK